MESFFSSFCYLRSGRRKETNSKHLLVTFYKWEPSRVLLKLSAGCEGHGAWLYIYVKFDLSIYLRLVYFLVCEACLNFKLRNHSGGKEGGKTLAAWKDWTKVNFRAAFSHRWCYNSGVKVWWRKGDSPWTHSLNEGAHYLQTSQTFQSCNIS